MNIKLIFYVCIAAVVAAFGYGVQNLYNEKVLLETEYEALDDKYTTLKSVSDENEKQIRNFKEDIEAASQQVASYQKDLDERNKELLALKKKKSQSEKQADKDISDYQASNPSLSPDEIYAYSVKLKSSLRNDALWANYCAYNPCTEK